MVFDEVSLMSLETLYDISYRLQAARKTIFFADQDERDKRDALATLPFGGWHVIFSGDLFQLPPVGGTRIYDRNFNNMNRFARSGYELWTKCLTYYVELVENFRCKPDVDNPTASMLPRFLQYARVGKVTKNMVEEINDHCLQPVIGFQKPKCNVGALWIAPTNAQVDKYNDDAFQILVNAGKTSYRAVAKHVNSGNNHFDKKNMPSITVIEKLFKNVNAKLPKGDISFAINQRVRVTGNLGTQLGIFNGALGTIVGFSFDSKRDMCEEWMHPCMAVHKLATHKRQSNTPIIYVKMDKLKASMTCLPNESNIVPFFMGDMVSHSIVADGKKYKRKQYALEPCSALTTNKAQGVTAHDGVVFNPGNPCSLRFAHAYVALSRVTDIRKLVVLSILVTDHFNRYADLNVIKAEYRRLEVDINKDPSQNNPLYVDE